ncbi:MAG: 30S ribosomal protein S21 [Chloroflexota bacterium]|nr:30S ribosomal protein S21 [Chloroflexota bacterium]
MTVELRPGESQEQLLKRFRKKVMHGRILSKLRRKRYFISKGEEERLKRKKAIRQARRRQREKRQLLF